MRLHFGAAILPGLGRIQQSQGIVAEEDAAIMPGVLALSKLLSSRSKMETMHEPMVDRCKENAAERKKRCPAKDGVKGCEQLGGIGFKPIDRSHAGQDHRCVQKASTQFRLAVM